jgi:hypothetical protein
MKRYVISSVTPGCNPNIKFLDSIASYCKAKKARAIFIPSMPIYNKDELPEIYRTYGTVLDSDFKVNNNLIISTLPINPTSSDPLTGLDRVASKEISVIYASPKQRLKSVASPSTKFPRVIMTPGSANFPMTNFKSGLNKTKVLSAVDHVNGAIVVEVENSTFFHFRQVQAGLDGSFVDLGLKYHGNKKPTSVKTVGLIPGDWHVGYTDPVVRQATIEMLDFLKPTNLVLHDFFDGISVNHHIEHKHILKATLGAKNSLSAELQLGAIELSSLGKKVKNVVIVKSNHDEFLDRWLEDGGYLKDSLNHIIGLELALAKANGKDPLEVGFKKFQQLKNVKFLKTHDSFKLSKKQIECGIHGHLGPDGARGSAANIEKSYTNAVMGHRHSPEIQRGTWVVGTSSYLQLEYNRGPSSWMQTHCVIYENGDRQLLNIVNKKWRLK